MSNLVNEFLQGRTPQEFLDDFAHLMQPKHDKLGGAVAPGGNIKRAGAERGNLIDDLVLLVGTGQLGDVTPAFEYYDSGAIAVGTIDTTGGNPVLASSVDISTGHNVLEMYAVSYYLTNTDVATPNPDGLELEFFQDAGLSRRFTTHTFFRQGEDQLINSAGHTIAARGRLMFETAPSSGIRRLYYRFTNSSATVAYQPQAMRIWGRLLTLTETIITDP